jgi:hypothetical protein
MRTRTGTRELERVIGRVDSRRVVCVIRCEPHHECWLPIGSTTTSTRGWRARCCAHHRRVSRCRSCEHHACEDGGCSCSMHACQALADSTPWRAHVGPCAGRKVECARETRHCVATELVKSVALCCAPIRLGYPISDTTSPENGGDAARNQPRSSVAHEEGGGLEARQYTGFWPHPFFDGFIRLMIYYSQSVYIIVDSFLNCMREQRCVFVLRSEFAATAPSVRRGVQQDRCCL